VYILGGSSTLLAITTRKARSLGSRNRDLQYFTAWIVPSFDQKSDQDLRKPELISEKVVVYHQAVWREGRAYIIVATIRRE